MKNNLHFCSKKSDKNNPQLNTDLFVFPENTMALGKVAYLEMSRHRKYCQSAKAWLFSPLDLHQKHKMERWCSFYI